MLTHLARSVSSHFACKAAKDESERSSNSSMSFSEFGVRGVILTTRQLGVRISLYCSLSTLVVAATDIGITILSMSYDVSNRLFLAAAAAALSEDESDGVESWRERGV